MISVVKLGVNYHFSMKARSDSNARKNISAYLAFKIKNQSGTMYQRITTASITGSEYTTIKADFVSRYSNNIEAVKLLIYGVGSGALIDEVLITDDNSGGSGSSSAGISGSSSGGGTSGTNYALNTDFNSGLQGWKSTFNFLVHHDVNDVNGGNDGKSGMKISNRQQWYYGSKKDVKGLISSNTTYELEADVFVEGSMRSDFKPYLYRTMANNRSYWTALGKTQVSPGVWQKVKMDIRVPDVNNTNALDLHLMGPAGSVNFKIDNVRLTKK